MTVKPHKKLYPWLVWFLAAAFLFYKYGLEVSPSVMASAFMRDFHATGAQLGNLAGSYFYAYLLMQIPMGVFTDRFGPRKVMSVAIAICAVGAVLLAYAEYLLLAETARFITGVGAAVAALGCLKITTLWFPPKRFARMAGLMMSLGMLGAVFGQAPLSEAMNHFGWRNSILYAGIVGVVYAFVFWFIVRDHGPHAHELEVEPAQEKASVIAGLLEVLRNKRTWVLSVYSGLAFAPVSVFGGLWGVPFLQQAYGVSRTLAGEMISLVFIGFAIGAPLFGYWSDRVGRRVPFMFWGTSLSLAASVLVLYMPNLPSMLCGSLLFAFGLFISTFLLCFTMVKQVNRLILAATAIGFMNSFDAGLGAITDPFIGKLLDMGWDGKLVDGARVFSLHDYHLGMLTIPLYLLLSLFLLFFIKETYDTQRV